MKFTFKYQVKTIFVNKHIILPKTLYLHTYIVICALYLIFGIFRSKKGDVICEIP